MLSKKAIMTENSEWVKPYANAVVFGSPVPSLALKSIFL